MIKPRLKSSKSWTNIPQNLQDQIIKLLNSHFSKPSKNGNFQVNGSIYKKEVVFRYSYQPKHLLKPIQFDLSLEYDFSSISKDDKFMKMFEILTDLGASLFHSIFEDKNFELPSLWNPIDFQNHKVYVQSENINTELESEANKILDLSSENKDLFQGDIEESRLTHNSEDDER